MVSKFKYILRTYMYKLSTDWYILSTYQVHTEYVLSTGLCCNLCRLHSELKSCYSVYYGVQPLCIHCMALSCNGTYSGIVRNHLYWYVAVHTSLKRLVMRLTILEKSTFQFGTEYIHICTAQVAGCTQYQIEMSISPESWGALQGVSRMYVPLHTSTSGFVRYLSTYQCSAVPTEYVLVCTSNFKIFASMYPYVPGCT
jgi:hypothetical protein